MKITTVFILLFSGLILVNACTSKKNTTEKPPMSDYPEAENLVPGSLLAELKLTSMSDQKGSTIYNAEIIEVIRYGRQAPILSKGATISLLCSVECADKKPQPGSTITAIIISNQNVSLDNTPKSSWEISKLY